MRAAVLAMFVGFAILGAVAWRLMPPNTQHAAFECPLPHQKMTAMALSETNAQKQSVTDALRGSGVENAILVTSHDLKKKYPSADVAEIVNYLSTAYCPLIAKEVDLSDGEKRARVQRFSSQVYQILKSQQ